MPPRPHCCPSFLTAGLVAVTAIFATGCDPHEAEAEVVPRFEPLTSGATTDLRGQVCDTRWMTVRLASGSTCTDVGHWTAEPVFTGPDVPPRLARYCRYTWSLEDAPVKADVDSFVQASRFDEAGPDCRSVTPEADVISEEIGDDLQDLFHWRVGRVEPGDLARVYPSATPDPVTVAVVDTYPSSQPADPRSDHGPIVASVVEAIACPDASCPVQVQPVLGLPRTIDGVDEVRGGYIARQSELATGVLDATSSTSPGPIVINLSVGWEAELFGGDDLSTALPAVDAVYDAIRVARCRGALIVAAAGNAAGLRCDETALAPAAWETVAAPTQAECIALGITSPYTDPAPYAPLVHAVGGLDRVERPMPGTREHGVPQLCATATHAVASPRAGLDRTAIRTGTSVSTAVVSAAAAQLWAHNPSLSPSRVMQALYEGGHIIAGETATFGLAGPGAPVRRIDVCESLSLACSLPGSVCGPSTGSLDCSPPLPRNLSEITADVAELSTSTEGLNVDGSKVDCVQACDAPSRQVRAPADVLRVCEETEREPGYRLTHPQPNRPGCQDCTLRVEPSGNGTAELTISVDYDPDDVVSIDIEVIDGATGQAYVYPVTEDVNGVYTATRLSHTSVSSYEVPLVLDEIDPVEAKIVMQFAGTRASTTEDTMILAME